MASSFTPASLQEAETLSTSLEESLLSLEKLDRTSPELWPERIPGVSEYMALRTPKDTLAEPWLKGMDTADIILLHKYANMSQNQLLMEIKKLHDTAYNLGLQEAKEMTRGRYLNIFNSKSKPQLLADIVRAHTERGLSTLAAGEQQQVKMPGWGSK